MRDKISKLAHMHVHDSIQNWIKEGCPSDSDQVVEEWSGAEGPPAPGVPRTLAQALARNAEFATAKSLFEVAGGKHEATYEQIEYEGTRPFSGPDGRPRERLFNDWKHEAKSLHMDLPDTKYLQLLVKHCFPSVLEAYREVRQGEPEVRPLAVEWDTEGKVPDGSIARHHEVDGKSTITIRDKAMTDLNYLEWVVKHELIHYLLNTPDELEDHGLEFQLMSELLGMPVKFRD